MPWFPCGPRRGSAPIQGEGGSTKKRIEAKKTVKVSPGALGPVSPPPASAMMSPFQHACHDFDPSNTKAFCNSIRDVLLDHISAYLKTIGIEGCVQLNTNSNQDGFELCFPDQSKLMPTFSLSFKDVTKNVDENRINVPLKLDGKPISFSIDLGDNCKVNSELVYTKEQELDIGEKVKFLGDCKDHLGGLISDAVAVKIEHAIKVRHLSGPLLQFALYKEAMDELDWMRAQFEGKSSREILDLSEERSREQYRNPNFLTCLSSLKSEFDSQYKGGHITPSDVSKLLYRASILSVKPEWRGLFALLPNSKLRGDEIILDSEKFSSIFREGDQPQRGIDDAQLSLRTVPFHDALNDIEIMLAMSLGTYFAGILAPGQFIYADGYQAFSDSLFIHDCAHKTVTLDYFYHNLVGGQFSSTTPRSIVVDGVAYPLDPNAKGEIKVSDGSLSVGTELHDDEEKVVMTITDDIYTGQYILNKKDFWGKVSFDDYFLSFRSKVKDRVSNLAPLNSKEELRNIFFAMFFQTHEPFPMGTMSTQRGHISPIRKYNIVSLMSRAVDQDSLAKLEKYFPKGALESVFGANINEKYGAVLSNVALARFLDRNDAAELMKPFISGVEFPSSLDDTEATKTLPAEDQLKCINKRKLRAEVLVTHYLGTVNSRPPGGKAKFKELLRQVDRHPDLFEEQTAVKWFDTFSDADIDSIFDYLCSVQGQLKKTEAMLESLSSSTA